MNKKSNLLNKKTKFLISVCFSASDLMYLVTAMKLQLCLDSCIKASLNLKRNVLVSVLAICLMKKLYIFM